MSNKRKGFQPIPIAKKAIAGPQQVDSIYGAIKAGKEYESIANVVPSSTCDLLEDVQRALSDIEALRNRPCLSYVGNVVRSGPGGGVSSEDDLPFDEMVRQVPSSEREVDVLLATRGGSAQQVARFVDCLRNRFDSVEFLIPSLCMSAGTLFALSGDRIWMTPSAALGPIDPQIPSSSGRFVPAQAMLALVEQVRREGEAAVAQGKTIPWTSAQLIHTIDKRELGEAITATAYSKNMAAQFLELYKFRHWTTKQTTGAAVTAAERRERAEWVAGELAKHERWNSHGHAISREVLWNEIQLHVDHPQGDLLGLIRKTWALYNWLFDKTNLLKLIVSKDYRFARHQPATRS